jgi:hypothetical protein
VLLCEDTVSLLAIRQFYQLVDDKDDTRQQCMAAAVGEAAQQADEKADEEADHHGEGSRRKTAALSEAAAQRLLLLKVDALLELLGRLSFHQVGMCPTTHLPSHQHCH